jgi:hypothetical protein
MKPATKTLPTRVTGLAALLLAATACDGAAGPDADVAVARQVAEALTASCPLAAPSDETARASCAAALSGDKALAAVMNEPFLWGGQKAGTSYHLEESNMNRFNVFVWRRMYLSLIMFPGDWTMERTADGLTVVHLPARFRNELEPGSYPYPFWHSEKKWDSYQLSREVILVIKDGKWVGAMRAADQDASRPRVAHTWSGQWRWQQGDAQMPYVSMYSYLLSPDNPNTQRLDTAYRDLSNGLRAQACFMCHAPDNHANLAQLEFFNYPNQALYSRNSIIQQLEMNAMPPAANDLGLAHGIADVGERQDLIALAREFKAAGDAALDFEGELKARPANP